jgi:hypothetical protein
VIGVVDEKAFFSFDNMRFAYEIAWVECIEPA